MKEKITEKHKFLFNNKRNILFPINLGNEGKLFLNITEKRILKKFKIFTEKLKEKKSSFGQEDNLKIAIKEIETFYSFLKMKCSRNEKEIIFEYDDVILPTNKLRFHDIAFSLKKQKELNIIIDDNKLENYGKVHVEGPIFKAIYNDFGYSFLKLKNNKNNYDKMFNSIVRDHFVLVTEYKNRNSREIVRTMRYFSPEKLALKNYRFKLFQEFVVTPIKESEYYLCYEFKGDLNKLDTIVKKYDFLHICKPHVTTLKIIRKSEHNKNYISHLYEDKVYTNDCSKFDIKKYEKYIEIESKEEHKELSENLVYEVESYKYKVIKNEK